jgi:hypothetical protein
MMKHRDVQCHFPPFKLNKASIAITLYTSSGGSGYNLDEDSSYPDNFFVFFPSWGKFHGSISERKKERNINFQLNWIQFPVQTTK